MICNVRKVEKRKYNAEAIELSSSGELINCISAAAIITGC